MQTEHIEWSKRTFGMMKIGGLWAVPRSGLIFKRTGETDLCLNERMPYSAVETITRETGEPLPCSKSEFHQYQEKDYAVIADHFRAAGITVRDATKEAQ